MAINLDQWAFSNMLVVGQIASETIQKFGKYWAQIHGILVMAIILDLRFKMQLVHYYFPQPYGEDVTNEIQRVRNLSNELVKFYEGNNGNMSDEVIVESSSVDVRSTFNIGAGGKFFYICKFEAFANKIVRP